MSQISQGIGVIGFHKIQTLVFGINKRRENECAKSARPGFDIKRREFVNRIIRTSKHWDYRSSSHHVFYHDQYDSIHPGYSSHPFSSTHRMDWNGRYCLLEFAALI